MGYSGESRVVEATAPACLDLAGGGLAPARGVDPDAVSAAVSVAIDRRASCRVETGTPGLYVESKDAPFRVLGRNVDELLAAGCAPLIPAVLRFLGIDSGLKITFQSRTPAGLGLGEDALVVAVSAAVLRAVGGDPEPDEIVRVAHDVLTALPRAAQAGVPRLQPAFQGGTWAFHLEPGAARAERLEADPGRVEESLLLVDTGGAAVPEIAREPALAQPGSEQVAREIAALAREVGHALAGHRYADVGGLIAREWELRKRLNPARDTPEVDRVVDIARAAGGAARTCGGGGAGLMLIWAQPGQGGEGSRERVERGLRDAGLRILPLRVDLRGLEVD